MITRTQAGFAALALVLFAAAGAVVGGTPAPTPDSTGGSIGVDIRKFGYQTTEVHFVRIAEGVDPLAADTVIRSTKSYDGQTFLVNAEPGRYVAIAAKLRPTGSNNMLGPLEVYFSGELIQQTEVTLRVGRFSFMGVIKPRLEGGPKEAGSVHRHYMALINPAAFEGNDLVGAMLQQLAAPESDGPAPVLYKMAWPGSLDRAIETEREFWERACRNLFKKSHTWRALIEVHLDTLPVEETIAGESSELDEIEPAASVTGTSDLTVESIGARIDAGRFADAAASARQRLAGIESRNGADSLEAAETIDLLVEALIRDRRVDDPGVAELTVRALAIKESKLEHDDPQLASSLKNRAFILRGDGDHDGARASYDRALRIQEEALGSQHLEVGRTLSWYTALAYGMDDLELAHDSIARALAIFDGHAEFALRDRATALRRLALLRYEDGEYPVALELSEEAIEVHRMVLRPDHPEIGKDLLVLGDALYMTGEKSAARSAYARALGIFERSLGHMHPHTAVALRMVGFVLARQGIYAAARVPIERAIVAYELAYGPDSKRVSRTQCDLADLLRRARFYDDARTLYEEVLVREERLRGPDGRVTMKALTGLARVQAKQEDHEAACHSYERIVAMRESWGEPDHLDVAWALHGLGRIYNRTGDPETAREVLERAIEIRERALGPNDRSLASVLHSLAIALVDLDDLDAARASLERAAEIRESADGPRSHGLADHLAGLAWVEGKLGDLDRARGLFERAVAILEDLYGPNSPSLAPTLEDYADLLREMGEKNKATKIDRRVAKIRKNS